MKFWGRNCLVSQFADDTALFLKNQYMVPKAINKISRFSEASGLTLNLRKCELLATHNCSQNNIANIPVNNEIKYLGLVITNNLHNREDLNITSRLKAVQKNLNHWLTRDLSLLGHILLSKAEDLSRLFYPCYSLFTSSKIIKLANSIIFKLIWKNKTHYLCESQLIKDFVNGGLRAMELESIIAAFKVKWLKECISQPQSIWYHIPNKLFNKVGGIHFLCKCDSEVSKIPIKLSEFHKQVLHFNKMIFTHNLFTTQFTTVE